MTKVTLRVDWDRSFPRVAHVNCMIQVIRARKVGKRKAWEELGDRYLAVEQKVTSYIHPLEVHVFRNLICHTFTDVNISIHLFSMHELIHTYICTRSGAHMWMISSDKKASIKRKGLRCAQPATA